MGEDGPRAVPGHGGPVEQIGFTDPVVHLYDGKILDGSHRYEVAKTLGRVRELDFRTLEGDPLAFVIAQNRARRYLTPVQVAARIVACREWAETGRPKNPEPGAAFSGANGEPSGTIGPTTVAEIAAEAGVSERTVRQIKAAEKAGLGEAIRSGQFSPKAVAEQIRAQTANSPAAPSALRTLRPRDPKASVRELEAQVDSLMAELQEKTRCIEELTNTISTLRGLLSQAGKKYPGRDQAGDGQQRRGIQAPQSDSGQNHLQGSMDLIPSDETTSEQGQPVPG